MIFFKKWWLEQDEETKKMVRQLVDEGRLQFINAGWSMSDEATVHYEDFINNMKVGHDFLKKELNYKPTVGWQIDTFGHPSATAAMFAEMGFSALFFTRIDKEDKAKRTDQKEMEFLWRPFNQTHGTRAEIFGFTIINHYGSPKGF